MQDAFEPHPSIAFVVENAPPASAIGGLVALFAAPEPLRGLIAGGLFLAAALTFFARIVLRATPGQVALVPVPEERVPPSLVTLSRELLPLGFVASPVVDVPMSSVTVTMLPLVHERERVYAAILSVHGAVTGVDLVSIAEGASGGLTTTNVPSGGISPTRPRSCRQVLIGLELSALWQAHLDGLAMLRGRGMRFKDVSAATFEADLNRAMDAQRRFLWEAPYRRALIAFTRAITGTSPHKRPLREQQVEV